MFLYGLFVAILVVVSLLLIVVILLQGGRGGLGEALGGSGSQSLFGGGTNMAITKFTAIGVATFFGACLILAMLSTARGRSVLEQVPLTMPEAVVPSLGDPVEAPAEPEAAVDEDLSGMLQAADEAVEALQPVGDAAQESTEAVLTVVESEPEQEAPAQVEPEQPAP